MNKKTTVVQLLVLAILTLYAISCGDDPCEATNANFVEMIVDGQPFVPTTVKATRTISGMEIKLKNDELEINIRTRKPAGTFIWDSLLINNSMEAWVELIENNGNYKLASKGKLSIFSCGSQVNGSLELEFGNSNLNGHFEGLNIEDLSPPGCLITEISSETKCGYDCSRSSSSIFEFDSEGRVVAISKSFDFAPSIFTIFVYSDGEVKNINYQYNGNRIVESQFSTQQGYDVGSDRYKWSYDGGGKISFFNLFATVARRGVIINDDYSMEIINNNNYSSITRSKVGNGSNTSTVLYDDKKSLGSLMLDAFDNQPVHFFHFFNTGGLYSFSNGSNLEIVMLSGNNAVQVDDFLFSYTYNKNDYPTSILKTHDGDTLQTISIGYINCK